MHMHTRKTNNKFRSYHRCWITHVTYTAGKGIVSIVSRLEEKAIVRSLTCRNICGNVCATYSEGPCPFLFQRFIRQFILFRAWKLCTRESESGLWHKDVEEHTMEPRQVFLKTREQFGKQCSFSMREAQIDEEIMPNPELMDNYYVSSYYDIGIQNVKQLALHEVSVTQLN